MSCLREVQTISKSPDILPMPSLTRLTTGGVLNPQKNTTNTSHNELLHQDPLQPPLEPRVWLDDEGTVQISIADGAEKEKILLVYTALDRLLDALGDKQSWAAIPTAQLSTIKEETGYTHLVVDYYVSDIVRKMSEYEG